MFHDRAFDCKSVRLAVSMIMGVALFNLVAAFTDEKLGQLAIMLMGAGDESVQGFIPVDQSVTGQKFQRAIDGRGFRAANIRMKLIDQIIGLHRTAMAQDKLKNMGP